MDSNTLIQTNSNVPPELSGPLPRRVGLTDDGRGSRIVIVLLMGLIVIGGLWYCKHVVQQVQQRSALRQDGVEVRGEITFLDRVGRGADIVRYTFAANGETIADKAEVPPQLMRSLRESNFLAVRYLPSNPAINHPTAWEWTLSSEWPMIVMLLMAGSLFGPISIKFFRAGKVVAYGIPAVGTVTNCRKTGRAVFTVEYGFRTATGKSINGKNSYTPQEIGAPVWILYLPQNPKRNLIYPSSGYYVER
jgi:hypothetical protein